MGDHRVVTERHIAENSRKPTLHGPLLALLTALFACRVLGQALVAFADVSWLPAMEQWFSGVIPYPSLLIIQLFMFILMTKISGDIWRGKGAFAVVQPRWSDFLIRLSIAYAGLMGVRYVLTMIRHPEMRWAGDIIPIAFHFVIAGFILALGNYHQVTTNP